MWSVPQHIQCLLLLLPYSLDKKKLSYRRETARQLRMSTYSWLTDSASTEHRRIAAEVVLFLTFKRSDSRSAGQKRILS